MPCIDEPFQNVRLKPVYRVLAEKHFEQIKQKVISCGQIFNQNRLEISPIRQRTHFGRIEID
jgi:hypothetical protein